MMFEKNSKIFVKLQVINMFIASMVGHKWMVLHSFWTWYVL